MIAINYNEGSEENIIINQNHPNKSMSHLPFPPFHGEQGQHHHEVGRRYDHFDGPLAQEPVPLADVGQPRLGGVGHAGFAL
jgi:hypothetical protein